MRPSASSPANFFFGLPRSQRSISSRRDLEADVVRRVRVARPGVAEADDQPVDGSGPAEGVPHYSLGGFGGLGVVAGRALGLRLGGLAVLADEPGLRLDVVLDGLERRRGDRRDDGLGIVEEGDALGRGEGLDGQRVVDLHVRDVDLDDVRDVARQRLDGDLAALLGEHAALGRRPGPRRRRELDGDGRLDGDLHVDPQQVRVHDVAAHGVALELLDHDGLGRAPPMVTSSTAPA